jgi:hypothetical protein
LSLQAQRGEKKEGFRSHAKKVPLRRQQYIYSKFNEEYGMNIHIQEQKICFERLSSTKREEDGRRSLERKGQLVLFGAHWGTEVFW